MISPYLNPAKKPISMYLTQIFCTKDLLIEINCPSKSKNDSDYVHSLDILGILEQKGKYGNIYHNWNPIWFQGPQVMKISNLMIYTCVWGESKKIPRPSSVANALIMKMHAFGLHEVKPQSN